MEKRVAMIGGGNMAGALVAGLVAAGYPVALIDVMDRNQAKCDRLQKDYGVNTHLKAGEWLKATEVVVLAVKPQGLSQTISQCKEFFSEGALYISIAAGIRVSDIARWLGSFNLVRAMPNTPALVKAGVVGLYVPDAALAQKEIAQSILCAMGEIITVQSEEQLDLLSTVPALPTCFALLRHWKRQRSSEALIQKKLVKWRSLRFWGRPSWLSPVTIHRLSFG